MTDSDATPTTSAPRRGGTTGHLLLDASVLVEVITPGAWRGPAERLRDQIAWATATTLMTASHGPIEAAHVLRRLARRSAEAEEASRGALEALLKLDLVLDPPGSRLPRAWELRDTMTVYDALYAAAAEALNLPLISTDERLIRACAAVDIPAVHLRDAFAD